MTTDDILSLNCKDPESMKIIKKALCKMKPFTKYENTEEQIPLEKIEKFLDVMCRKYEVKNQYVMFSRHEPEGSWYTFSSMRADTNEWIGSVYGCSIYEVFAKTAIRIYSMVKKGQIPERNNEQ